jgi:hypothetical protein
LPNPFILSDVNTGPSLTSIFALNQSLNGGHVMGGTQVAIPQTHFGLFNRVLNGRFTGMRRVPRIQVLLNRLKDSRFLLRVAR